MRYLPDYVTLGFMDIEKAYEYARKKHKGQLRKDGTPYIEHPIRVSGMLRDSGFGEEYQIAGLFHDLLEDTDATDEEILALSNEAVLKAVKLVTKYDGYDEHAYIENILLDPIARAVKNADRIDNLRDSIHADTSFCRRYLKDTEKNYLGRFSSELDEEYSRLKERLR